MGRRAVTMFDVKANIDIETHGATEPIGWRPR
jgi:hypothetical protein